MAMQIGGGKGMMMKKPVILVLTSICVAALLLLPSVIYPEAISLSLSFSRIRESIRSWQSGNLSDASSSSPSSSVSAMNLDEDGDGDDVGVRIRDADIECSSPLKVFMYDLPRKYNLGMVKKDDGINQELPWTDQEVAPALKTRWGVNRQHSVEYWMMLDMLQDDHDPSHNHDGKKEEKKAAVRVKDPEQADVFFVPFFSSLSFNTYGRIMLGPEAKIDKLLQMGVVEMLMESKWWQASQGHDHVIVVHHPNAFRYYRERLKDSILIVADFGRYPKEIAQLQKDVVAPYEHVVPMWKEDDDDSIADPFASRNILLFFQGRVERKDDGTVRRTLAKLLENRTDVHFVNSLPSEEGVEQATKGMRSSRFCLHPAGDTPSSCRLFDAIVSHCVPVIVSDKIELPFEDELDYTEFALFFSAEEAIRPRDYLLNYLRNFDKEHWLRMWKRLKEVSHHFHYQHPPKTDDAVNMIWKQVQRKLPAAQLAIHRLQRHNLADRM
ncbi:unnamed protein product [Sphagnum tenellum]